jgi:hypothetical protein
VANPNRDVVGSVQDQGGHLDTRQHISDVGFGVHLHQCPVPVGTRRPAFKCSEPLPKVMVIGKGGGEEVDRAVSAPMLDLRLDEPIEHIRRIAPGVILGLGHPCERPVEDEGRDPLWERGREEHRHRPTL